MNKYGNKEEKKEKRRRNNGVRSTIGLEIKKKNGYRCENSINFVMCHHKNIRLAANGEATKKGALFRIGNMLNSFSQPIQLVEYFKYGSFFSAR